MALGLVERFFLSLAFFWAGLHLVGFGIEFSGTAGPGNPVWPLIHALYSTEAAVLHALYRLIQAASLVLLLIALVRGFTALGGFLQARQEASPQPPASLHQYSPSPPKACETESRPAPAEPTAQAHSSSGPRLPEQSARLTPAPARIEMPKPPTAQELKIKAIQQILRG